MTYLKFSIFFLLSLTFAACSNDDNRDLPKSNDSIVGDWQLTEALISSGGEQEWVTIEDGAYYQFNENGDFTSNHFSECATGEYSLESGLLSLNYTCENFQSQNENEDGIISYNVDLEKGEMLLNPQSFICTEGCTYKFQRVSNESQL